MKLRGVAVLAIVLWTVSCGLNPQPEPPGATNGSTGSNDGGVSSGGSSGGGFGGNGTGGTGGAAGAGGSLDMPGDAGEPVQGIDGGVPDAAPPRDSGAPADAATDAHDTDAADTGAADGAVHRKHLHGR